MVYAGPAGVIGGERDYSVGGEPSGVLENPLDWPFMAVAAGLVILFATAIRILCRHACWSHFSIAVNRSVTGLTTAAVVLIGCSLSLPGSFWGGLALLWGLVAAEEYWTWKAVVQGGPPCRRQTGLLPHAVRRRTAAVLENTHFSPPPPALAAPATMEAESCGLPAGVLQQLVRNRVPDGTESLSGWVRASLAAGQRTASVHVAFAPPFPRAPSFDVAQQEGEPARIKVVQLLPYGARLDFEAPSTKPVGRGTRASFHRRNCCCPTGQSELTQIIHGPTPTRSVSEDCIITYLAYASGWC